MLHYFGLDCWGGFFQTFYSEAVIQRTVVDFPAFLRPVCRKDCGLCPFNLSAEEVGGLELFLYETAQNFELFSNIQDQNLKNQNPVAVDVLFNANPMVSHSGCSNLAGWYLPQSAIRQIFLLKFVRLFIQNLRLRK
jgi:hypothetical protein